MKRFLILLSALILLGATANAQQKYKAYVVSNAHFDTQWNWTVQTSIDQYVKKTITQNLYLLDTYPEYIFNFEGGIKYYWMKEYYPEYYERVKDYILKGRWHITGSTWDANDPNMPSTESFIRNVMYGQHYYRDEFGPQFMSKDIFLPDCFGFGYTLPTVAAHCGLTGFSTQKLQWRENAFFPDGKKIPFPIGLWKGVDGSQILGCLDARSYGQRWNEDISYNQDLIDLAASSSLGIAYRYYGTGDTGGSPSIASVESVIKGSKSDGPVKIIIAGSDQIMEDFYPFENHPELPVYDGELLQDVHATGCYTSQAAMKRFNRRNEQLGDAAERASVVADWFGGLSYQKQTIDDAWKRVIWHQFHDDLTGTSTPYVYQFSWNDEIISETQFADVITAATGAVSQALATNVKGSPVVVYNPVGYQRSDIVTAKVPFASRPAGVAVYGPDGKSVPAQLVDYADGEATVIFAANVKPVSFSVYDVRSSSAKKGSLKVTNNTIENAVYRLTLDANGDIASLYDKRNNKEIVEGGKALRLAFFEENKSVKWPAWEIKKDMIDKTPVAITGNVKTTVVENGPVRATIKVERTKDGSNFVQYISLTSGTYEDRVVVKNEFDWNSSGKLLKAEFPFSFSNPNATYDLGIGSVERGNNKINAYEVIGHQWADITASDGSYGVSIMNDCKYGWDKPADNTIRLTLLHTPETERSYVYQNQNDLGHHTFTYAIVGHKGNYHEGGTVKNAESLNQPLMAFNTTKHSGSLGREFAMVKNVDPSLAFRAFKKAQDGKSYIVRVYESAGKGVNGAAVTFNAEIESAREVNGIEEDKGAAKFSGNTLYVDATKFQPKTYAVTFKKAPVNIAPAKNVFVPLTYTASAWSKDSFVATTGRFDRQGNSFAEELIPDVIDVQGVKFATSQDLDMHVVRCAGDEIVLPEGHNSNKLYMLVSATDTNRVATFKVDNKEYEVKVPYYTGKFGQWGQKGYSKGYVRDAKIGFFGTHRHTRLGNESHTYTYMYEVELDINPNAKVVTLPKNSSVMLFAATLSNNACDNVKPAYEFRALPQAEVFDTYDATEPPAMTMRR